VADVETMVELASTTDYRFVSRWRPTLAEELASSLIGNVKSSIANPQKGLKDEQNLVGRV